jgi:regulator of sigma E protease
LPLVVERNGQRVPLTIVPTTRTEDGEILGTLDFVPDNGGFPVVITEVTVDAPAAAAGILPGDRVVAVQGQPVRSAEHVTNYVREHPTDPVTLTLERNGEKKDITATPRKLTDEVPRLGIRPADKYPLVKSGFGAAATYAVRSNLEILRLTGKALGQFFTGQRSASNTLSGPVGIYKAAGSAVERFGWGGFFTTLSFLSLNLGIFNLLPIPVLDGGAIFLLLIEGALATVGMKLSMRVRDRIQQVGFVAVILLMVFVITNDFVKEAARWRGGGDKPAVTSPK